MSISKKTLRYKDFEGSIEVDLEDDLLYGQILFINDVITYEGDNICELKEAFKNMVDEYIKYCEELGIKPQKTYSGSFNIRPGAEIHQKLVQDAEINGITLNQLIKNIFEEYFANKETKEFPVNSYAEQSNSYIEKYLCGNNNYSQTNLSWSFRPKDVYIYRGNNINTRLFPNDRDHVYSIINNLKNKIK